MENNKLVAQKLDVEMLLNLLEQLYHRGVNYLDISIEYLPDKVSVGFEYTKDYIDPEFMHYYEEDESNTKPQGKYKLTDNDINQLI